MSMENLYCKPTQPNNFFRKLWLMAALFLFSSQINAQCPSGEVILYSQEDIDEFGMLYPNCTVISSLIIDDEVENVSNLSPLGNIINIIGDLLIRDTQLTNLEGLSSLTNLSELRIEHNDNLVSLDGLNGLQNVEEIQMRGNPILSDISGLENINPMTLGRLIIISNNSLSVCSLPNICQYLANGGSSLFSNASGCHNVNAVRTNCFPPPPCDAPTAITSSGIISDKATINWTSSGNTFDIEWGVSGFTQGTGTTQNGVSGNSYTITGLAESTSYDVYIRQNCTDNQSDWVKHTFTTLSVCPEGDVIYLNTQEDVDNFGLMYPNCTQINASIYMGNAIGNISDLSPLNHIESISEISIINNHELTDLNGFTSLTNVGKLIIFGNAEMTTISGFSSLTNVGLISIDLNNILSDISGLQNVNPATLTSLHILYNFTLSVCNLPNFCEYLSGSGSRNIADNAPGCSNLEEVVAACNPVSCETPTAITSTGIISDKATINWTSDGELFDLEWGVSGFTQGTGTTQNGVSGNSYTITNLSELTSYDVYIRQNCTNNQTDWVKHTFTTLSVCPEAVPLTEDYSLVYLPSQEAINNFGTMYPNCTHIQDHLFIGIFSLVGPTESNITDLSPLSNLQNVGKTITISYNKITNLNGLSSLTNAGSLELYRNTQLTSVDGLTSLTSLGDLNIQSSERLTNLNGLNNLQSISGYVRIGGENDSDYQRGNLLLSDISALQNADISSVHTLTIMNNPLLSVCALPNFCAYLSGPRQRFIQGNAQGCESVTAITANCPIPCETPTDLISSDVTHNNATINWTSEGELFDIEWGIEGFVQGEGTSETGITLNSFELSDLLTNTSHDVYIRQNCTENQSEWVKHTFTTLELICPTGDLSFSTQAELENFKLTYPNCTEIDGTLLLSGAQGGNITDLSPLNGIEKIAGAFLVINNWDLPNLDGLSSLTTIVGHLQITNNFSLTDLDGLTNLTSLGADITIAYNDNLASVAGLSGLTTINPTFGDGLVIFNNMVLSTCEIDLFCNYLSNDSTTHPRTIHDNGQDCNDVETILLACYPPIACPEGDVIINSQEDLDFYAANYPLCTIINGNLLIENSDITELSVLNNIQTVTGELYIIGNSQLINVDGMSSLQSVGSNLYLAFNDNLSNIDGFSSLTTIGGFLNFDYNPLVNNLDGFIALETIAGELIIGSGGLTNLDGLSNLREVGGEGIYIVDNSVLQDVSGLAGVNLDLLNPIDEYGGIIILYNPLLSVCTLPNFCAYLADPANPRSISDNAPGCEDSNAVMTACAEPSYDGITWTTDNVWSNETGPASTEDDIYIEGNLMTTGDLLAKNITVRNGGNFVISSGNMLTLAGKIINEAGVANFVVESGANLIQTEEIENEGSITVVRDSNPMKRLDYTLWSSPVANQNLFGFSPETVNGVTNYHGSTGRIYIYDGVIDTYVNPNPFDSITIMNPVIGYLFRAPNNYHATNEQIYKGTFTGVPNNGFLYTLTHAGGYSSVGNPYPSNISADSFLGLNPGVSALYFWDNSVTVGSNYAVYTTAGGTAAGDNDVVPDGVITVGQGFTVDHLYLGVFFENHLRVGAPGTFFRANQTEKHRFWLDFTNENNERFNQTLIAYMDGATNAIDNQIDGKLFASETSALYNIIAQDKFAIQGRALPFENSDVVQLGLKAVQSGKFNISLSNFDGLFVQGNTIIYLKDKELDLTHNLNESAYTFESEAGEFNERFEIVYGTDGTMETEDLNANAVQIYTQNQNIIVESKIEKILSVELFDLSGRKIHPNQKVNANLYQIKSNSKGVLVVKVQTQKGEILTKKIISK